MDLSIFNIGNNDFTHCENTSEITKDEFIVKSKKILEQIQEVWGKSHKQKFAPTELITKMQCENCTGENTFIRDGKEFECIQGEEDCFERYIDLDELYTDIQDIVCGEKSELYDLLSSNIV